MIERYSTPELKKIWSEENKYKKWLEVELAVLRVLESKKIVPKGTVHNIQRRALISVKRIHEIEKEVKHDVIAFTTSVSERSGDAGRFFHYGMTSSDVVDTALSLLLKESLLLIEKKLEEVLRSLKKVAITYKKLPCIGRTHGVHAEPMSFGLKFLFAYAEFQRNHQRLQSVLGSISHGKLSGAVGCYGKVLSPEIEKKALNLLGLEAEPISTQVLPRDRHAEVFQWIALMGTSIERLCVELRHLQRTEVREIEEEFSIGQKGSSAMPHKKNPISAENLSGCARLLRGYSFSAIENVALWHERDISHSSVERVIAPDATILLHYMLGRLNQLVLKLSVRKKQVDENLKASFGIFFSGHLLLKMVEKGMSREDAYAIVQKTAHLSWDKQKAFESEIAKNAQIRQYFSTRELSKILDVKNYLEHVDEIYKRVFSHNEIKRKKKAKK